MTATKAKGFLKTVDAGDLDERTRALAKLLNVTRCGNTLYMYDKASKSAVEKQIVARAKRTGERIHWADGRQEWYDWDVVFDTSKTGAACYTWDKDGNKVLYHRVRFVQACGRDGRITETIIGKAYRWEE